MARKSTVKSEPVKSTAAKVEVAKTETAKADVVKAESLKFAPAKVETVKAASEKAPRAKTVKAKPTSARSIFSLQHVPGATVLVENVGSGLVVAPKLKPGCTVAISYLKDVERPLSAALLHARIDGAPVPTKELGHTDPEGRFVRTPAALELAPTAQKIEYWIELKTTDGQTLWDSNWGRNHWLEVEPALAGPTPTTP